MGCRRWGQGCLGSFGNGGSGGLGVVPKTFTTGDTGGTQGKPVRNPYLLAVWGLACSEAVPMASPARISSTRRFCLGPSGGSLVAVGSGFSQAFASPPAGLVSFVTKKT